MKTQLQKLKKRFPQLVEEYSAMDKEQLLEQICAEVNDLHDMYDRVQFFMNECTNGMSKTTYTIESLKQMVAQKQEKDIQEFCYYETVDGQTDSEIATEIRQQAELYLQ